MTKRLPAITATKVIKEARKIDFVYDRPAKGSHQIWYNPQTKRRFMAAAHKGKTLKRKTIKSIISQMGITVAEFNKI